MKPKNDQEYSNQQAGQTDNEHWARQLQAICTDIQTLREEITYARPRPSFKIDVSSDALFFISYQLKIEK